MQRARARPHDQKQGATQGHGPGHKLSRRLAVPLPLAQAPQGQQQQGEDHAREGRGVVGKEKHFHGEAREIGAGHRQQEACFPGERTPRKSHGQGGNHHHQGEREQRAKIKHPEVKEFGRDDRQHAQGRACLLVEIQLIVRIEIAQQPGGDKPAQAGEIAT